MYNYVLGKSKEELEIAFLVLEMRSKMTCSFGAALGKLDIGFNLEIRHRKIFSKQS